MAKSALKSMPKSKVLGTFTTIGQIEINEPISDFSVIVICVAWGESYTGFAFIPAAKWSANNNNAFPIMLNNGTDTNGITVTYRSLNESKFWFTVGRTNSNVNFQVIGIY